MPKPCTLLAVDTSTGPASTALIKDGICIGSYEDADSSHQSKRLVCDIDALMHTHSVDYSELNAIAVVIGPGGFTGIRIGLAAARGIAIACSIPLIGITSLEALAWQAFREQEDVQTITSIINAHRKMVYLQTFRRTSINPYSIHDPIEITICNINNIIDRYTPDVTIGNIETSDISPYIKTPSPHARYAGELAYSLLSQDEAAAIASHPATAFYIRPPDAKPQTPLHI